MTALGTRPATDVHRAFWRELLLAGESTTVPRWAAEPSPGAAEVEVPLSDATLVTLRRLADRLAVPLGSVLLAAHTQVLAALCGERDVVTGYVAGDGGRLLPYRLSTDADSWRALVHQAAGVEAGLREHRGVPVDDLRRELGVTGLVSETVFDPTGESGELPAEAWSRSRSPGARSRAASARADRGRCRGDPQSGRRAAPPRPAGRAARRPARGGTRRAGRPPDPVPVSPGRTSCQPLTARGRGPRGAAQDSGGPPLASACPSAPAGRTQ